MNDQQYDRLLSALEKQNALIMAAYQSDKLKSTATHNTAQLFHGPGGLFSGAGLDQTILTTHIRPRGIGSVIPAFPSFDVNPAFATLTGVSDDIGAEPVDVCADAPTGYIKGCTLTGRFGRIIRDTNTIEPGATLLRLHRGDFQDLRLVGNLLSEDGNGVMFPSDLNEADFMNMVTKAEMVNAGIRVERKLAKMIWTGSPSASVGNGYIEFPGIDNQVVTGHVDRDDGNVLCPSVDSLVMSANFLKVANYDIVGALSAGIFYTENLAQETFGSADFAIVMRPQMWQEVTEVWPCQYNTGACGPLATGNARVILDGKANVDARDEMRRSFTLHINGKDYPVILDTAIHEDNAATNANLDPGQYSSSIYFLPLRVNGNMPVLYWEYLDWRAAMPQVALTQQNAEFWTDGGRFLWGYEATAAWCYKLKLRTEPRIILRTPQLAFRIDGLMIEPQLHLRDYDPKSFYWVNGGVSLRPTPVQNAVWL